MNASIAALVKKHTGRVVTKSTGRRKKPAFRSPPLSEKNLAHSITNDFFYNITNDLYKDHPGDDREDRRDTNALRDRFEDRHYNTVLKLVLKGIKNGSITADMNTRPIPRNLYHLLAHAVR